jgi:putative glutamine amidotransferase
LDGIIFTGGGDIDASRYNGRVDLCTRVDVERDRGEFDLFEAAYSSEIPLLCICRGLQIANVALGGTLIEDLSAHFGANYSIKHHQIDELAVERPIPSHSVRVVPDSRLYRIIAAAAPDSSVVRVNSVHHQAIRKLSSELQAVAYSDDGVIEAVELVEPSSRFFIGIQWHPESLAVRDGGARALFAAFLEASEAFQKHKIAFSTTKP